MKLADMSLHRILSLAVVLLAVLALGSVVSLMWLATSLHRSTVQLETALQSVRVAEEMQVDLLTYIRTEDPFLRDRVESDLRQRLYQARDYANTPEEIQLLDEAGRSIEAHIEETEKAPELKRTDGQMERAFAALRRFIDINVQQAGDSMRGSEKLDDIGERIGMGVGAALIMGITLVLVWLRSVAFQPVFAIQQAIRDFAAGHKDTRAPENGPEELKIIAKQFNEMAISLDRQYERQLSFLAAVAHDLRNPLVAMKLSANALSSDRQLSPETVTNLMSVIKRQVNALDRMIGDLLDTSRIEAGHLELRLTECDGRTIAHEAFDLYRMASKDHQLTLTLPSAPVLVRCDPVRIQQVLNNLVSNAVKYSPSGTKIELSVENIGHEVRFRVADQGIGIAQSEIACVFEPFRRTAFSRKEEVPGVGLGLSVAQRIVKAHGGRIQVDSEVGKGSTFWVYLPAIETTQAKLSA
jgi:two-component system, OmpR family, sensor histidine kinase MtrB